MDPERRGPSLHELLAAAVERAARAQELSHAIIEDQRAVTESLRATMESVENGRRERATFGNGHPGAGKRSRPG